MPGPKQADTGLLLFPWEQQAFCHIQSRTFCPRELRQTKTDPTKNGAHGLLSSGSSSRTTQASPGSLEGGPNAEAVGFPALCLDKSPRLTAMMRNDSDREHACLESFPSDIKVRASCQRWSSQNASMWGVRAASNKVLIGCRIMGAVWPTPLFAVMSHTRLST